VHARIMCILSDFDYNNNDDDEDENGNVFQHLIVLFGCLFVYSVSSYSVPVMIHRNVVIGLSSVPPFGQRINLIYEQQAGHCYEINVFIF
jgi:hypothetical protein